MFAFHVVEFIQNVVPVSLCCNSITADIHELYFTDAEGTLGFHSWTFLFLLHVFYVRF